MTEDLKWHPITGSDTGGRWRSWDHFDEDHDPGIRISYGCVEECGWVVQVYVVGESTRHMQRLTEDEAKRRAEVLARAVLEVWQPVEVTP